jgi:cell division septum initiation protein DivIVA
MPEKTPKLNGKIEIVEIIARLEAITGSATKLPLTRRAVINPREIQELVNQLRNSLPSDINEALQIIRYRDALVSQAQTDASRMRQKAEQESMQKVSDTQVVRDAKAKAQAIIEEAGKERQKVLDEAEKEAAAKIDGADRYAIEVLTRLEAEMETLLQTARRGIESLKEGKVLEEQA